MFPMKIGVIALLLSLFLSVTAVAQSSSDCDVVVKKLFFENTTGITAKQHAALSKLLLGHCFQRSHPDVLTKIVFDQLNKWGYKATVIDPDKGHDIRILDTDVHPSPVAVTIDFSIDGLAECKK